MTNKDKSSIINTWTAIVQFITNKGIDKMSKFKQVEEYIQDWNLTKLVSDQEIKDFIRGEPFDARELTKGLVECGLLKEAAE